ncbi:hypothetical protein Tco_0859186 [Tanacetum coccineum]|uniref:Uncharacterized protein n=1 Tax=Tanacetum coccineum TaxID=301880 RepID=A0ABQ5BGY0_9ASTR
MHVPRAIFVDLEPSVIDEVGNRRIRILAFRMLVRGLREKAQTWLQYLPVSTEPFAVVVPIKSFPIKTYYCLAEKVAGIIKNSENEIHVLIRHIVAGWFVSPKAGILTWPTICGCVKSQEQERVERGKSSFTATISKLKEAQMKIKGYD